MNKIDTVIFDLGGTLIDYAGRYDSWPELETPGFTAAYDYFQSRGQALPEFNQFKEVGFSILPDRWRQAMEGDKNLTVPSLLTDVFTTLQLGIPDQELLAGAAERYQMAVCADARPIADGKAVLNHLKQSGLKLGLISNTMFTAQAHINDLFRFGLRDFFEAMVFSADENQWKPNSAPFLHVLKELGSKPSRALFIGDDPKVDVVGSHQAGLYTVYFQSSERFSSLDGLIPDATIQELSQLPMLLKRLKA